MTKRIQGSCFNISIYRTASDAELLSIMVKDDEFKFWKFNLGEWKKLFASNGDRIMNNYMDVVQIFKETVTIEVDENAKGNDMLVI